jgi:hypothetical protein
MQRRRKISVSRRHLRLKTSENCWLKQKQIQKTATLCVLKNFKTLGFTQKRVVCAKNQTKLAKLKLKRLLKALTLVTFWRYCGVSIRMRWKFSRLSSLKTKFRPPASSTRQLGLPHWTAIQDLKPSILLQAEIAVWISLKVKSSILGRSLIFCRSTWSVCHGRPKSIFSAAANKVIIQATS